MKPRYSVVMPISFADNQSVIRELNDLGYKPNGEQGLGETVVTYSQGIYNILPKHTPNARKGLGNMINQVVLDEYNLDLFLTLASQTSDSDLNNWFLFLSDDFRAFTLGKLYQCKNERLNDYISFFDDDGAKNGLGKTNSEYFRKASADEIIAFFNPNQTKQMKKEKFAVSGNKHLLKAFEQDLLENGYTESYWGKGDYKCINILSTHEGEVHGICDPESIQYVLPLQYDIAKEKALSFLRKTCIDYTIRLNENDVILVRIKKDTLDFKNVTISIDVFNSIVHNLNNLISKQIDDWKVSIPYVAVGCKHIPIGDILEINRLHKEVLEETLRK